MIKFQNFWKAQISDIRITMMMQILRYNYFHKNNIYDLYMARYLYKDVLFSIKAYYDVPQMFRHTKSSKYKNTTL